VEKEINEFKKKRGREGDERTKNKRRGKKGDILINIILVTVSSCLIWYG
jgi:hypothetical protein